jgi:hypothetical protein
LTSVVVTVVYSIVNFCATISPPTYKLPPIPTPPVTVKAPVAVLVAASVEVILVVVNVPVLAVILPTPTISPPPESRSPPADPAIVNVPPIYRSLPIATPPATCNAPVLVDVALVVPGTIILVAVNTVPLNVNPVPNVVAPAAL